MIKSNGRRAKRTKKVACQSSLHPEVVIIGVIRLIGVTVNNGRMVDHRKRGSIYTVTVISCRRIW